MDPHGFLARLLASPNVKDQQKLLRNSLNHFHPQDIDALAEGLKDQVIKCLWSNTQDALALADLILYLAGLTKNKSYLALGFRAKAQAVMLGRGEFQQALDLYNQAVDIYQDLGDQVGIADVNVTRIWALANLGFYNQAVEEAEHAIQILEQHARWQALATLHNNLATIHNRAGKSDLALDMHTKARDAYLQLGEGGEPFLATSEMNRAWDFYELALYYDSILASQRALALAEQFDQSTVIARANHNMGVTYLRLGRNNEALQVFEKAREIHLSNGQVHEAALCELSSLDCLFELRRFEEVLSICQNIIPIFKEKGMQLEGAESIQYQAMALFKLTRYQEAVDALQNARHLFEEEGNQLWISFTDLETAALMLRIRDPEGCKNICEKCIVDFENLNHPVEAAFARLVAARAANSLEEMSLAEDWAQEALLVAGNQNIPFLTYQGNKILGQIAQKKNDITTALIHYDLAISALEKMSANMMTEYYSEFFEDKVSVYESAADFCIHTGQPDLSLAYVERAKSRALLKILAFRPQLGIQAQDEGDEPLVAEINDLRLERERLLRYLDEHKFDLEKERYQEKITSVELQVTALWHKLLVRNAGYGQQASIWQAQTEDARRYLEEGVLLLEYFSVGEHFFVFMVNQGEDIRAHRLSATSVEIERYLQLFAMNTRALVQPGSTHKAALIVNAQALLGKLYQLLLGPIGEELNKFHQLIIVPHGVLHYLPFHALHDGNSYLIERFPISYLPGSSFLGHYLNTKTAGHGIVSIGHSYHGHVPNAVLEAGKIAQLFNTEPLLEGDAVLENLQDLVPGKQILHIACHGEFYPDNPLFSGLCLEDGWLTTLDVFNLRLPVSLATLSACKTGRSVVGGGDELLGIMRAFLAAGAASLLLSHWAVEDRSTLLLIETFYQNLISGKMKAVALQHAQVHLLTHRERTPLAEEHESSAYSHPYYWASFFLIGDYRRL